MEDPKAIHALAEGRTPPRLRTDLEGLLESPIVIRTDVLTEGNSPILLSPRSETLDSIESALTWLKKNASEIVMKGVSAKRFCFLAHRYITARSGAFGLSRPENPRVRIDSIWGLPDGLLSFPHDSFEVDTDRKGQVQRHIRCKPFYLACNERGAWTQKEVLCTVGLAFIPDSGRAGIHCTPNQEGCNLDQGNLWKSCFLSALIASRVIQRYFLGYMSLTSPASLRRRPSIITRDGLSQFLTKLTCTNSAKSLIKRKSDRKSTSGYNPAPELLRSKEFVNRVADTANELRLPVLLEGSILSQIHAYAEPLLEGVRVRCTNPFVPYSQKEEVR